MFKKSIFILLFCFTNYLVAIENIGLLEDNWTLTSMYQKDINLDQYETQKPYLILQSNYRYSAYAGCNRINGSFSLNNDNEINFNPNSIMTKMACMQDNNIEDKFIQLLDKVKFWEIKEKTLIFTDGNHTTLANFTSTYK